MLRTRPVKFCISSSTIIFDARRRRNKKMRLASSGDMESLKAKWRGQAEQAIKLKIKLPWTYFLAIFLKSRIGLRGSSGSGYWTKKFFMISNQNITSINEIMNMTTGFSGAPKLAKKAAKIQDTAEQIMIMNVKIATGFDSGFKMSLSQGERFAWPYAFSSSLRWSASVASVSFLSVLWA